MTPFRRHAFGRERSSFRLGDSIAHGKALFEAHVRYIGRGTFPVANYFYLEVRQRLAARAQ